MAKFRQPEEFDFKNPEAWPTWKRRFERFRIATKLSSEDESVQVSSLIYAMGNEADDIHAQFTFTNADDSMKWTPVVDKFDAYFKPHKNVIHNRALFHKRRQQPTESIEEFYRELHRLADTCDFANKSEAIRDIFVIGITDSEIAKKLQLTQDLTLADAIRQARQAEEVDSHIKDQAHGSARVDAVRQNKHHQRGSSRRGPTKETHANTKNYAKNWTPRQSTTARSTSTSQRTQSGSSESCGNCGYQHSKDSCPAFWSQMLLMWEDRTLP